MGIEDISEHTEQRNDRGALLAKTIRVNALFSGGCGLVLLVAATALTGPLGLSAWLLAGLGDPEPHRNQLLAASG